MAVPNISHPEKIRGASLQNAQVLVIANRNPHNHVAGLAPHLPNPQ
jgi:hypothetical protein